MQQNKSQKIIIQKEILLNYTSFLVTKSGQELLDLENQLQKVQNEIRNLNQKSAKNYKFTTEKLVTLMKWKLKRGQFRPQLEKLANSNSTDKTEEVFINAFNIINSKKELDKKIVGQALDAVCVLSGVGPATGSKILSLINEKIPFMSDEAMQMCGISLNYNKSTYLKLYEKMQEIVKNDEICQQEEINVENLEKIFWCVKMEEKFKKQKKEIVELKDNNKSNNNTQKQKKRKTQKVIIDIEDDEDEGQKKSSKKQKQSFDIITKQQQQTQNNNKKLKKK